MFAVIFISDGKYHYIVGEYPGTFRGLQPNGGRSVFALVIATFPTLIIYCFMSKKIQESLMAGAIKG